jgi:hypothetical protein
LLTAAVMSGLATAAAAQNYPTRPITLIVPFPPGGSTTIVARIVTDRMADAIGQQFVVDNRGGASSSPGSGERRRGRLLRGLSSRRCRWSGSSLPGRPMPQWTPRLRFARASAKLATPRAGT